MDNISTEDIIDVLKLKMENMPDYKRIEVIESLMENYCNYCGSGYLPCHCNNDE